jgi:hypothetical protein
MESRTTAPSILNFDTRWMFGRGGKGKIIVPAGNETSVVHPVATDWIFRVIFKL